MAEPCLPYTNVCLAPSGSSLSMGVGPVISLLLKFGYLSFLRKNKSRNF